MTYDSAEQREATRLDPDPLYVPEPSSFVVLSRLTGGVLASFSTEGAARDWLVRWDDYDDITLVRFGATPADNEVLPLHRHIPSRWQPILAALVTGFVLGATAIILLYERSGIR